MIVNLFGKEWIVINEEIAIYLSFLIVLTILINNLGGTLVNSFNEQSRKVFYRIKIIINIITIFILLTTIIFIININDVDYETIKNINERFYVRFVVFNFIFFSNMLMLMFEKTSKYWYILYLLQLTVFFFFFFKKLLIVNELDSIICSLVILYCLLLLGMLFKEAAMNFYKEKYNKGIDAQNKFYNIVVKKNRILNSIIYLRNIIILRLGLEELPENPSYRFWFFHSILLFTVWFLCIIGAYKTIFTIAIFCISIDAKAKTLAENYKDSKGFKHNFDLNTRYLNIKFAKNNYKKVDHAPVIKRYYSGVADEQIKIVARKIFDYSHTNPKPRTLVMVGGTLVFVGVTGTIGYVVTNYIHDKEHSKVSLDQQAKVHNCKLDQQAKEHNCKLDQQAKEHNCKLDQQAKEHEYKMKKLEYDNKKSNWGWPFNR